MLGVGCGTTTVNPRDFDDPPACLVTGTNPPGSSGTLPIENCPDLTRPPGTPTTTGRSSSTGPRTTVAPTSPPTGPSTSPSTLGTVVPGPRADEKAELARNRDRWASTHPASYRYTWSNGCFCPQSATGPFIVTVRGDTVQLEPKKPGHLEPMDSLKPGIDDAFTTAAQALDRADEVTIEYDPTYGYPASIVIDWVKDAVDDEESLTISDLTAIS